MNYLYSRKQLTSSWQPDLQQYINACHICGDVSRVNDGELKAWYAKHGKNHYLEGEK